MLQCLVSADAACIQECLSSSLLNTSFINRVWGVLHYAQLQKILVLFNISCTVRLVLRLQEWESLCTSETVFAGERQSELLAVGVGDIIWGQCCPESLSWDQALSLALHCRLRVRRLPVWRSRGGALDFNPGYLHSFWFLWFFFSWSGSTDLIGASRERFNFLCQGVICN